MSVLLFTLHFTKNLCTQINQIDNWVTEPMLGIQWKNTFPDKQYKYIIISTSLHQKNVHSD